MTEWTEIIITVNIKNIETAADIANMAVPYGIYIEDYSNLEAETMEIAHIDLIDEELIAKDRSKGLVHIYINSEENPAEAVSFLKERYETVGIPFELELKGINQEDWANNWKSYFKPINIGEKLLIQPTWIEDAPNQGRAILRIDPGMAFGTGGHATTKLCMEALENHTHKGAEVLDVGSGSGILSIAALLLGAKAATGVDIDAVAVRTANENAALNGFSQEQCRFVHGNLTEKVSGRFDVVVANIVADVIIYFTPQVAGFMSKNAVFITSGIIDTREAEVLAALEQSGFEVLERKEDAGWVCIVSKVDCE
ncbi:MAG: 50S ribosomal protein L11 methyltransferase [Oscillospiraceae bacterium]|jgi:ribosomal protein L11 methyltransferase|nr:50S ribosomal protein L11 methyltransferase [Oscillospiraceae bacterium]